ncbi:Ycf48-like protein [compost metagenome]
MQSPQTVPDAGSSGSACPPSRAGVSRPDPRFRTPSRPAAHALRKAQAQGVILPWIGRLSPWVLIAGLAYAAVFVKPSANGAPLSQPVLERRDMFFGAAGDLASSWVVGQDGAILHGVDGATQWSREVLPTRTNLQAVAVSPAGVVVAVGNLGDLWLKAPGQAWSHAPLPVGEVGGKLLDVAFIDGHFWVSGEMGVLFRAGPDAGNWERLGDEQDVGFNAIRPGTGGDLWIAAEFGRLLRSRDGGQSWSTLELGSESLRAVAFEGQVGVAVGNAGHAYVSRDGGDSWNAVAPFTTDHLHDVVVKEGLWSVVGDHGVYFQSRTPSEAWQDVAPAGLSKGYFTRVLPVAGGNLLVGQQLAMIEAGRLTVITAGGRP